MEFRVAVGLSINLTDRQRMRWGTFFFTAYKEHENGNIVNEWQRGMKNDAQGQQYRTS